MPKSLTRADAEKALEALRKQQAPAIEAGGTGPELREDWDWLGGSPVPFALVWEEGPFEWAYLFPHGGRDAEFGFTVADVRGDIPASVFCEPVTTWAIGLYPA